MNSSKMDVIKIVFVSLLRTVIFHFPFFHHRNSRLIKKNISYHSYNLNLSLISTKKVNAPNKLTTLIVFGNYILISETYVSNVYELI